MESAKGLVNLAVLTALVVGVIVAGCGEDESPTAPGPPPPAYTPAESTTVLPPEEEETILDYDSDTGAMAMDSTSEYAQDIAVGTVLLGQDDDVAPDGFLRKVTAVTTEDGRLVVETEPALLTDAFEQMAIADTVWLRPSQIRAQHLLRGTTFFPDEADETFSVQLNCVVFDADGDYGTTDDQIKIIGSYAFTAALLAEINISWFTLEKLEIVVETEQEVDLDLVAGFEWEFESEREFDLWKVRLGAVPVGGVVWIVPTLTVEAHVHGDLTVTFETGITYTQEIRSGFGYNKDARPQFYPIFASEKDSEFTPPDFTAEFDFEAGASLNASCLLYGVAGPYMAGKTGFNFRSVLSADPCDVELNFDLEAIFYAVVGIEMDAYVFNLDWSKDYELYTHPIGSWDFPLGGSGTVVVDPNPNVINAPWTLTGPCEYSQSGSGDESLTSLYPGEYSITWGVVSGYVTPPGETHTLVADGTITFSGTYVEEEEETGTIMIDQTPNVLSGAGWTLTGPENRSGSGDRTLTKMPVGAYTLTWSSLSGYVTPASQMKTLVADGTITFSGTYVEEEETGTIAHWKCDSANIEDDVLIDLSGNGNDGVICGAISDGSALIFDGVDDYVLVDQEASFDLSIYTIEVIFQISEGRPEDSAIISKNGHFYVEVTASTHPYWPNRLNYIHFSASGGVFNILCTELTPFSEPVHVAFTVDDNRAVAYLNRSLSQEIEPPYYSPPRNRSDSPVYIGAPGYGAILNFKGKIYEIRVTRGVLEPEDFLKSEEEETGTVVIDQSPNVLAGAGWTLTGPENRSGSGDRTLTEMPVGAYTLTWSSVSGYVTPASETKTLLADGTVTFWGTYVPSDPTEGLVLIPGGSFTMGSPPGEYARWSDETQHQVTLTHSFYMWVTEVTNVQYAELAQWAYDRGYCMATSSSLSDALDGSTKELLDLNHYGCEISFSGGTFSVDAGKEDHPAKEVTWYGAVAYCDWLSLRDGRPRAYSHATWQCNGHAPYSASGYRLSTEAEWEYACRAGTGTPFNTGECLDAGTEANYNGNYPYTGCPSGPYVGWTVPVGSYPANGYGLYDMHGNLWEWCNDWYATYSGAEINPAGPATGADRVIRGGSYTNSAEHCRSADRTSYAPGDSDYRIGFRPVSSVH